LAGTDVRDNAARCEAATVNTFQRLSPTKGTRPLLGVRNRPGRLALAVFRLPLPLYRAGRGWLLGRAFVLLVHAGRKTGQPHAMTAMVLDYDPASGEVVICANWGATCDWIRNIRARPALRVQIGGKSFAPQHRFLTDDESFAVAIDFRRRHPHRVRFAARVLGWSDMCSDAVVHDFVATRPFVAFRPAAEEPPGTTDSLLMT
jgi:deazaflavin-dependent oxidoreductase (nitroreductase family)